MIGTVIGAIGGVAASVAVIRKNMTDKKALKELNRMNQEGLQSLDKAKKR
jgi:hypothetical protein